MAADDLIHLYLVHLRETGHSARTIEDRARILDGLDRWLPTGLDLAADDELRQWVWRDGLKPNSRNTYFSALTGFYRWAVATGWLTPDPTVEMVRPKQQKGVPRPCTAAQVDYILVNAAEPYRLWALLAAAAGLRCIEVTRILREDVTEEWTRVVRGKGDKTRMVPTHQLLWAAVREMPPGRLVQLEMPRTISTRFCHYMRYGLKMRGVSMHRLRDYFATEILDRQGDLRVVQELLGHSDPGTTAVYTKVANRKLRAGVSLLPILEGAGGGSEPAAA